MKKRDVYRGYNIIIIISSLILILNSMILSNIFENFFVYTNILGSILGSVFFGLAIYSLIMLVYILAKRKKEEYIFGFVTPLLLFGFSLLAEGSRISPFNKITTPNLYLLIILFFYSLYHFWRKSS